MYKFDKNLYEENIFKNVNKADIATFLDLKSTPKIKKEDLVKKLKQLFKEDPLAKRRYCKKFCKQVGVWPADVEALPGCIKNGAPALDKRKQAACCRISAFHAWRISAIRSYLYRRTKARND